MAFSEAERRRWHADRRAGRDQDHGVTERPVCSRSGNPLATSVGVVTDDFSICDICNRD